VAAVRTQVSPRASGEYRLDLGTALAEQGRDDMREQHVPEIVPVEGAEHDDPALRADASVSQTATCSSEASSGSMNGSFVRKPEILILESKTC
jgi:hypothetical protein